MNTQLLFGIAVVPTIIGLVEVCKRAGLPSQFAPALAVAYGIAAAIAEVLAGTYPWIPAVFLGISFGLSASGLYSGVKTALSAAQADPALATPPTVSQTPSPVAEKTTPSNAAAAPIHTDDPTPKP